MIEVKGMIHNHAILEFHNKEFNFLDEEGNQRAVQGIPRAATIWEILAMQLKKCYKKGYQIFGAHMEEAPKDKVKNLDDHSFLKYCDDVFKEIPRLPPKKDIDLSINLIPRAAPV
jgi:hypothetical protein